MKRMLIGGIVGGIIMFVWSAFSHMVLPLGGMGLKPLPNESAVIPAMKEGIREPGLYMFPGLDMSKTPSAEEQAAWTERYKAGPVGLLVYRPQGEAPMSLKQLGTELLSNILAALVGAFMLTFVVGSYGKRALFVALLGLVAWLSINVSHWNWYGFPTAFVVAEGIDQVVGWLLAGLAMAKIVKPSN